MNFHRVTKAGAVLEPPGVVPRRQALQLAQSRPRHVREIMMLQVEPVVDRDGVHRSVVGRRLVGALEDDVLLQDMRAGRMGTYREVGRERQIEQRVPAEPQHHRDAGSEHQHDIGGKPAVEGDAPRHLQGMQQRIGEGLRQHPEELAEAAPAHQPHLPGHRYVGIEAAIAQEAVMQQVVVAEADRARRHARQVGHDRHRLVEGRAANDEIVRGLVDDDVEVMLGEGADADGGDDRHPPGLLRHRRGQRELPRDHDAGEPRGPRAGPEQLLYRGVFAQDRRPALTMKASVIHGAGPPARCRRSNPRAARRRRNCDRRRHSGGRGGAASDRCRAARSGATDGSRNA